MNDIPAELMNIMNRDYTHADYQFECLKKQIIDFQQNLDNEQEIALLLPSLGSNEPFYVQAITYKNPSMLIFYGIYQGNSSRLIQNINQLCFLMVSVPKLVPELPPCRIGFSVD